MDFIQVVMSNSDPSGSVGQGSNVVYFCLVLFLKICQEALLEKAMATHSSVLAWRIPGTGEPGGLPSTGSHRDGHD